jgi:hypothetical protein
MKKAIFIFMLIISAITTLSQNISTYTEAFDNVFQNVSYSDATTGILYNRVIPFSGLCKFIYPDTANSEIFKQAYSELHDAAFLPPFA